LVTTCIGVAQNVGIGTTTPDAKLDVIGTLKISDGTQGDGKILTSDATGLASWQPPPPAPPVYYPVVWICCNPWMIKNLDVETYRNGDPIPLVTDDAAWAALTTGAYCYYDNDPTTYAATYGKLYNWYAVNDPRGLAPEGWHISSDLEWTSLADCLGGDAIAGGPIKEFGTMHWNDPNNGATNLSNFTALPGGWRFLNGTFFNNGTHGFWWTPRENNTTMAWDRFLANNEFILYTGLHDKRSGFSFRCLRD
jgi:uncharacterized protein (TIGR02145 family)